MSAQLIGKRAKTRRAEGSQSGNDLDLDLGWLIYVMFAVMSVTVSFKGIDKA